MMANFWQTLLMVSIVLVVILSIMMLVYYLVSYRNIKQRRAHFEHLHQHLKPGQKVEFANGLIGKVVKVELETCDIEIKSGAVVTVSRYAITDLLEA
ncbi:preprotein translocase subunit YajC [Tuanshanicoccus lijuaniae]|uniref:preprotein translocase subunit YajC n=1 Tax=Aerococcaceae bacterium zg-1292 TaxID=2774330 RepID=UPI001BD8372A|nr:preprotein translocase subunit YajC [Aerococcaceae bacterium zg-BR9]MBS4455403.1 preprotein translocase subunit YajC [Aerococcaceae bacterium zg-A91]MBS4457363.1 preprotein translocase subunit YajC [Aerococcaceae bacterium zg-BR33]